MTTSQRVDRDLCLALSHLFIGGEVDYAYVVSVAKPFPITDIEFALIDCVAPVLWTEFYSPTPEIWGYDEERLWSAIQEHIKSSENMTPLKKILFRLRHILMKKILKSEWKRLIASLSYKEA